MNKKKLIIICFSLLLMFPLVTNATSFVPNVSIGEFKAGTATTTDGSSIGKYIKAIYEYLSSIIGLVAAVALVIGGVIWLTAGGSSQRVSQAKSWISGSLTGLVLVLLSWLILQTINPNLVSFTSLDMSKIEPTVIGCCQFELVDGKIRAIDTSALECYQLLSDAQKMGSPIPTTTQEIIDKSPYNGKISEYIKENVKNKPNCTFNAAKIAEGGKCVELGWCTIGTNISSPSIPTVGARATKNMCITNLSGWVDAGYRLNEPDTLTKYPCKTVGTEGFIYRWLKPGFSNRPVFWCYNGRGYRGDGKENEPCGNENSICVKVKYEDDYIVTDEDGDAKTWAARDYGGRDCESNLKCFKRSYIKPSYYTDL